MGSGKKVHVHKNTKLYRLHPNTHTHTDVSFIIIKKVKPKRSRGNNNNEHQNRMKFRKKIGTKLNETVIMLSVRFTNENGKPFAAYFLELFTCLLFACVHE